jgi:hypothetical protein
MNRAQRRGNLVRVRRTASSVLAVQRRDQARSGVEHDVGRLATRSAEQPRDSSGRFTGSRAAEAVVDVFDAMYGPGANGAGDLSRQQRRYLARQAAKKGGAR